MQHRRNTKGHIFFSNSPLKHDLSLGGVFVCVFLVNVLGLLLCFGLCLFAYLFVCLWGFFREGGG